MNDSPVRYNDRARLVVKKRADEAAADLRAALRAFLAERRLAQEITARAQAT